MPTSPHDENVWSGLDLEALQRCARQGPPPLFATVSGAHLYGFSSPDSDVDLRGAFVIPASELLGLAQVEETHQVESSTDGVELDFVAHDIGKFARMMLRHNGYVLEQLFSPLIVLGGTRHDELCEIGRGCVTRPLYRHYRGFAHGRRKLLDAPGATVKHLLYAYRVYLTGIHALRTGQIEANLPALNEAFRISCIDDLVARKREGHERENLRTGEVEQHAARLDALEAELEQAHATSRLPEEPSATGALADFVVRVRLRTLGRGR